MSTRTGSWRYGGGNGMRVRLEVTRSPVYHTSVEVRYYVKIYTQNQYRYNDYQYMNLTGDLSGQIQYNNTSGSNSWGGGWVQRYSTTYTYTYGANSYGSSPGKVTFGGRVSGAYNGVTPSVSGTWSIPARPYDDPAEPSNVTLERPSVSRLELSWNRHPTSGEPYHSQEVQLREFTGSSWGSYRRVATVTGGASSYVRTAGVGGNTIFQMRVRAQNSAGRSGWAYSGVATTPPDSPSQVRAKLNSDGASVALSWSDNAYDPPSSLGAVTFTVNRRPGSSGTWSQVASGVSGTSWTDTAPEPGDNQYEVCADSTVYPGSSSTFTSSGVVSTIVPPLAPTDLKPDGDAVDLDGDVTLSWTHRDGGDGADQSHYSIEYSDDFGSTWVPLVTGVASTVSQHVLPGGTLPNREGNYEWRVQTQGVTTEAFGPWSIGGILFGYDAPVVTITSPGFEANSLPLVVTWDYVQAQGESATWFDVTLFEEDGETVLERAEGLPGIASGGSSGHTFDFFVEDSESYLIEVTPRSQWFASYVDSSARQATTIKLPVPRALAITTQWSDVDGSVMLHAEVDLGDGEPAPATITNLATNPSAEVDLAGWARGLGSNSYHRDESMSFTGSASVETTWATGDATSGFVGLTVGGLTVGEVYTAGAWVRVPAGSPPVDLTAYFVSRENAPTTITDQWVWLTHTFTASATSESVGITNAEPTTSGQAAWIDSVIVVEGYVLSEYFDGDTKSLPDREFSWTGTPHASTSVSSARGEVDPTSATIERRVVGDEWVTLARELPLPVDFMDPLPSTTGQTEYRVTSVSETPSYRVNDPVIVGGPDGGRNGGSWGYLSYGPGFTTTLRLRANMNIGGSGGRTRIAQPLLGRRKPLLLTGANTTHTVDVSGVLINDESGDTIDPTDSSTPHEFLLAGQDALVVCWRDVTGRRLFGQLSDVTVDQSRTGIADVGFSITETDFTESYGGV